jgi:hypothetical protein
MNPYRNMDACSCSVYEIFTLSYNPYISSHSDIFSVGHINEDKKKNNIFTGGERRE